MAGVRVAPFTDSERSTRCVGQTAPDDRFGGRSFTEGELAAGRAVVARRRAGLGSRRRGPGLTPGRVGFAPPRAVVARTRAGLGSRRRGPGLTPGRAMVAAPRGPWSRGRGLGWVRAAAGRDSRRAGLGSRRRGPWPRTRTRAGAVVAHANARRAWSRGGGSARPRRPSPSLLVPGPSCACQAADHHRRRDRCAPRRRNVPARHIRAPRNGAWCATGSSCSPRGTPTGRRDLLGHGTARHGAARHGATRHETGAAGDGDPGSLTPRTVD
jgi:hypothetical protein